MFCKSRYFSPVSVADFQQNTIKEKKFIVIFLNFHIGNIEVNERRRKNLRFRSGENTSGSIFPKIDIILLLSSL